MIPSISIIIPTYYRNQHLNATLSTIESQSLPDEQIETIVVDDSGEGYARPIANNDVVSNYIALHENRGPAAARDKGIEQAQGEHIKLLDDDDHLTQDALELLLNEVKRTDASIVYGGVKWGENHIVKPNPEVCGEVLDHALGFNMAPCIPSTMLIQRDAMHSVLPTEELPSDDHAMQIELAKEYKYEYIENPVITRAATDESRGATKGMVDRRWETIDYYEDHYHERDESIRKTAESYTHLLAAQVTLNNRIWSPRAISEAGKAVYHNPSIEFLGYFMSSFLGRPGRDYARSIYMRFFADDKHEGKLA